MQSIDTGDGLAARLRHGSMLLRAETLRIQAKQYACKFRPDQLRIPRGSPTGGEWTFDPRSRRAQDERARLMPAFLPGVAVAGAEGALATVELALTLFAWLSAQSTNDKRATLRFKAWKFEPASQEKLSLESLEMLDRGKAEQACPRLPLVQSMTDETTARLRAARPELSPTQLGSLIHYDISQQIKELDDPDFKAEFSALKSRDASTADRRGFRIDVLHEVDDETVCVFDMKTGKEGLYRTRALELAAEANASFGIKPRTIIVIEVRPLQ